MKLSKFNILFTLFLPLIIVGCGSNSSSQVASSNNVILMPNIAEQKMLTLINSVRASGYQCHGEHNDAQHPNGYYSPTFPLKWNSSLALSAHKYAYEMSQNNHFDHVGTDGSTLEKRDENAGYAHWKFLSENLALGDDDSDIGIQNAVHGLLESDLGHCQNIMNPIARDIGLGYAKGEHSYWVQDFGAQ